jgi:hypothetical protein
LNLLRHVDRGDSTLTACVIEGLGDRDPQPGGVPRSIVMFGVRAFVNELPRA